MRDHPFAMEDEQVEKHSRCSMRQTLQRYAMPLDDGAQQNDGINDFTSRTALLLLIRSY